MLILYVMLNGSEKVRHPEGPLFLQRAEGSREEYFELIRAATGTPRFASVLWTITSADDEPSRAGFHPVSSGALYH
jgi:hypothetical protein